MRSIETNKSHVDMSPGAITARIKRACSLGDAERHMAIIKGLILEIRDGEIPELLVDIPRRQIRIK